MREPHGIGREYVYECLWDMNHDVNNFCNILRRNALGSLGMFQVMKWWLLTCPCSWVDQVACFKMPFGPVRYGDGKLGGGGLWLSASLSYHLHARPEIEDMWDVGQWGRLIFVFHCFIYYEVLIFDVIAWYFMLFYDVCMFASVLTLNRTGQDVSRWHEWLQCMLNVQGRIHEPWACTTRWKKNVWKS